MNRIVLGIALFIGMTVYGQNDPTIMTIDGKAITKSEFLQIYLKNNNDPKYDKATMDEYMELFKKFKLKVAEAEAMGYDTIPKLVKELNGYKKQLALPYLIDSAKNEALVKEAYERTKMEVRASHIMLKSTPNDTPEDTLRKYNQLMEMKKRIEKGESFESIAKGPGGSEDPSAAKNGGDLGYFTAFQMVYPFEETAYTTPVGEVSNPFRTRFGYHILKVTDQRPARGTIETAHIMVSVRAGEGADAETAAKAKIDEIYGLLESGDSFETLVEKYSDDPSTNKKGGVLPPFGSGTSSRMVPEFEEAAFSIDKDGGYSKPVRTSYGWHIIKRISLSPVPSFEEMKDGLENKVAKDERAKTTQESFVQKLKKEYNFADKSAKPMKWFYSNMDSTYFKGKWNAKELSKDAVMFTLANQSHGQREFANYLMSNYRGVHGDDFKAIIDNQYKNWVKSTVLDYEESQLTGKYPAYKALVNEYHDGILLYEVMSDMVWNKAMKDTVGLKAYFEANKSNYQWGPRVDAEIFECYTKEAADQAYKLLQKDTTSANYVIKSINANSELNIRHRNGKFETTRTSYLKDQKLSKGLNKVYESEGKFYVIKVSEMIDPMPKEFSEAKGAITSDYQNYLEQEWLKELARKHTIVVNSDVLYSLGK